MKRPVFALLFVLIGARVTGAQSVPSSTQWEYCLLQAPEGFSLVREEPQGTAFKRTYALEARICFAEARGCRWQIVQATTSRIENTAHPLGPNGDDPAIEATAQALARLGNEGWELQSEGSVSAFYGSSSAKRALLFKRLRPRAAVSQ